MIQKALSSEVFGTLRPNHRTFHAMQAARKREIQFATALLLDSRIDAQGWGDRMDSILLEGHTRAWVLGRQRAGDYRDITDMDRLMGLAAKDGDADFLRRFIEDLEARDPRYFDPKGGLRMAPVLARANLYVGKMRGTAGESFVRASKDDDEFLWVLGAVEKHCSDCPRIAALSPFTKETLFTFPGDGDTECLGNCKCHLRRVGDGVNSFKAELGEEDIPVAPPESEPEQEPPNFNWPDADEIEKTRQPFGNDNVNTTYRAETSKGPFFVKAFDDTEAGIEGELAAKEIADELGIGDWIPETTSMIIDSDQHMVMAWVEGVRLGADPEKYLAAVPREDRCRLLLFDYLIGNQDRHTGNLLIDAAGNFVLIDHERAFKDELDWHPRAVYAYDLDSVDDAQKRRFRISKRVLRRFLRSRAQVADIAIKYGMNAVALTARYKILEKLATIKRPTVQDLIDLVPDADLWA